MFGSGIRFWWSLALGVIFLPSLWPRVGGLGSKPSSSSSAFSFHSSTRPPTRGHSSLKAPPSPSVPALRGGVALLWPTRRKRRARGGEPHGGGAPLPLPRQAPTRSRWPSVCWWPCSDRLTVRVLLGGQHLRAHLSRYLQRSGWAEEARRSHFCTPNLVSFP